jgi:hypothetical protein
MAQTKARASSRSSSKGRGGSAKAKSKSSPGKSNGQARAQSAQQAVEKTAKEASRTAKEAGQSVGRAANRAKVPLIASGAALMGAAGGLAVGARSQRAKGIARALQRRPKVKVSSRDMASAAKEVGAFGTQMGRLADELRSARESDSKHRSPVEILLEGLTARRSRS